MAKLIYPLTESVLEGEDINAAIKVLRSKKLPWGQKLDRLRLILKII